VLSSSREVTHKRAICRFAFPYHVTKADAVNSVDSEADGGE
jgi:hypothetical protein